VPQSLMVRHSTSSKEKQQFVDVGVPRKYLRTMQLMVEGVFGTGGLNQSEGDGRLAYHRWVGARRKRKMVSGIYISTRTRIQPSLAARPDPSVVRQSSSPSDWLSPPVPKTPSTI